MKNLLKILLPSILIICLLILTGCAPKAIPSIEERGSAFPAHAPAPTPLPPGKVISPEITTTPGHGVAEGDTGGTTIDRKIVRTGYITLVVNSIIETLPKITNLANQLGGFVVSSNIFEGDDMVSGNISIRIPAQRFDEAMEQLRKLAVKVPSESTNSQDITEEYIDLKARLSNLEATEAQYLELLKKAQNVKEMLEVQQALSDVRAQIEQTKGRIQYLERTSDMSYIEINLREVSSFHEKNGWDIIETLKSAVRGLTSFGKALANIMIWIIVFIPLWVVIGVIVWLITRYIKKRRKAKA